MRMANEQLHSIIARHIRPKLKRKLYKAAAEENISVRALAERLVCARYGVTYERAAARAQPKHRHEFGQSAIIIYVPTSVRDALRADTGTNSDIVRRILSEAFDEPFTPHGRWPTAA